MPRKKTIKFTLKKKSRRSLNYVIVNNRSYGSKLKGLKIYFEGRKPKQLKDDGSIKFGKHILEALKVKFKKFRWIISKTTNSIKSRHGICEIKTSTALLEKMGGEYWGRSRDIKNDIVRSFFAITFPTHFSDCDATTYIPNSLSRLLNPNIVPTLSTEDRRALIDFLPSFISSESIGSVNLLKATAEIQSLRELAINLEKAIKSEHSETWWQKYIRANILIIQQGYIMAIEKINIAIVTTKFPDFSLVTHDNYLDILEIKKPNTGLIKYDASHGNYYWDTGLSKAIIQVENYIASITAHSDPVRSYLNDNYKISLKVLRPRGIILAGDTRVFTTQKEKDDFRLLSLSLKNIMIVTYDELLTRINNYIKVLEEYGGKDNGSKKNKRGA